MLHFQREYQREERNKNSLIFQIVNYNKFCIWDYVTDLKSFSPTFQPYGFREQITFVPYDIFACHSAFSWAATWPKLTALLTFIWCLHAKLCSSPHLHGNQGYSAFSLFLSFSVSFCSTLSPLFPFMLLSPLFNSFYPAHSHLRLWGKY